jgi:cell division protein FtsL
VVKENSGNQGQQDSQTDPNIQTSFTPDPVSGKQSSHDTTGKNSATKPNETLKPFEKRVLVATWAGVLAAAVTIIFIYSQFKIMAYQTSILATQTESAIASASASEAETRNQLALSEKQTKIAQKSVEAIQRQTRQGQRAWLKVSVDGPVHWNIGQNVGTQVTLVNTGITPARKILCHTVIEKISNPNSPQFHYGGLNDSKFRLGLMYPEKPITQEISMLDAKTKNKTEVIISEADGIELNNKKAYFAIYSLVEYYDIFGVYHWTKFCYWAAAPSGEFSAGKCTDYNNVDNN